MKLYIFPSAYCKAAETRGKKKIQSQNLDNPENSSYVPLSKTCNCCAGNVGDEILNIISKLIFYIQLNAEILELKYILCALLFFFRSNEHICETKKTDLVDWVDENQNQAIKQGPTEFPILQFLQKLLNL